jgi:hypothetical protein
VNIQPDDLDAAVAAGVMPAAQADALRRFVANRNRAALSYGMEDERFRFMRGFNDFFFAIGIVLLGAAMIHYLGNLAAAYGRGHPAMPTAIWALGAAAVWALSELLVGRMRLVLPGILLSLLFVFFVLRGTPAVNLIGNVQIPPYAGSGSFLSQFVHIALAEIPLKALAATAAAAIFYVRFQLPFALLLVAGSLVMLAMALAALFLPLDVNRTAIDIAMTLICGLAVFAAAMAFDVSDPARRTRRADCAFWLHLLAAPLIVHSLISIALHVLAAPSRGNFYEVMSQATGVTAAIILGLTLIAIVIDRRALLVSALTYLGAIIAYAITRAAGEDISVFYATLLALGIIVLVLGIGWRPLRRLLLGLFPAAIVNRLPPVVPA